MPNNRLIHRIGIALLSCCALALMTYAFVAPFSDVDPLHRLVIMGFDKMAAGIDLLFARAPGARSAPASLVDTLVKQIMQMVIASMQMLVTWLLWFQVGDFVHTGACRWDAARKREPNNQTAY
ncbi:MAG: hypothetical protein ACREX0_09005 [Noviherbaspirillum sp.]